MAAFFRKKYRTRSARLPNWDYSADGYYFVTICTKNREPFFGCICKNKMHLSDIGLLVTEYWKMIPKQFPNIRLDEFVIMPDHIHGIIIINNNNCISNKLDGNMHFRDGCRRNTIDDGKRGGATGKYNPLLSQNSLAKIIRWFKGRCRFEINRLHGEMHFGWQPRYYDHIVRNENSLRNIRKYIRENPRK